MPRAFMAATINRTPISGSDLIKTVIKIQDTPPYKNKTGMSFPTEKRFSRKLLAIDPLMEPTAKKVNTKP